MLGCQYTPMSVRARHILVPEAEQCEALRGLAGDLEAFASLAREHSGCPSGRRGGDLGTFGRGQMVPAFEAAAFAQPVGRAGECVETPFGYHLLWVEERSV